MKQVLGITAWLACWLSTVAAAELPKPLVTGLKYPRAVVGAADGRIYLAEGGEGIGKGHILVVEGDKAVPFATGLQEPQEMIAFQQWLFVLDKDRVLRIDKKGKLEEYITGKEIGSPSLTAIAVDEAGTLYVSGRNAIYRIDPKKKVTLVVDAKMNPVLEKMLPKAITMDGRSHLLVLVGYKDRYQDELHRFKITDGTSTKITGELGHAGGLVWDHHGRLYFSSGPGKGMEVSVIPRPGENAVDLPYRLRGPGMLGYDPAGKRILIVEGDSLYAVAAQVPGQEVDESPLPLATAVAFPDLQWTGWKPETAQGKVNKLRPIVLTHAGDGSNRVFVATQQGVLHVFPNDQKATKTQVFLDLQDRVSWNEKQNEEGFLGLAFHPNYKKTGEFFVFYTTNKAKLVNVVSRFRVSKDDPNKADPDSEEVLLRFEKPYWNHDGGTICFGPDGYLYITHGDGGDANDPQKNGQNLKTLLGKVLRIDIDHKDAGKNYAVPKDNPFVDRKDAAPEIWAYGLRNIWRMSFDRKTGTLWAGEVGQNLYEEINLITKGGNYGWSIRESLHPFGATGVGVRKDLIDPIWEYHHEVGKSICGGHVYRGSRLPELDGTYLYADYVTGRVWGLKYDEAKRRVVANRPIKAGGAPILSFGEDEKGEVYSLEETLTGKGIRWFVRSVEEKK